MPELPEVETVVRGLSLKILGGTIKTLHLARDNLRIPFPKDLKSIEGKRIDKIERRAKYILMHLDNGRTIILHLGMSGRMVIFGKGDVYEKQKHDHAVLVFKDGVTAVFNDPRRFGLIDLGETKEIAAHRFFRHLGPEPLEPAFNAKMLAAALEGRKTSIKVAIMDQRIVVGVGNIYASEALFDSGIDPARAAGSLKKPEIEKLVAAVRDVLKRAIKAGGSSLRDYVQTDGELGYFQHQFKVYDKEGLKCPGCTCSLAKTGGIKRITQGGRSTFYCATKQK